MRIRRRSQTLYAAETAERALALTFDDGPSPSTPAILDILGEHGVPAAFFVVGDAIGGREEILRRTRAEGHDIGNHSKTHPRLDHLKRSAVRAELSAAAEMIESVLGEPAFLFRPPYFGFNRGVLRAAEACGYRHTVCASVYTNDWDATDGALIAQEILAKVEPGCVIDLHDGRPPHDPPHAEGGSQADRSATVEAVRILVPELLARGFRFVRVSELFGLQRDHLAQTRA